MLTAAAMAVAIALAAFACWFVVRDRLYDQVRDSLGGGPPNVVNPQQRYVSCDPTAQAALDRAVAANAVDDRRFPGGFDKWDVQLITADTVCFPLSSTRIIKTTAADLAVLGTHGYSYRDGEYANGEPAMVRRSAVTMNVDGVTGQYVQLVAASTESVQTSLRELAFVLMGVAALGVVGAGFTGRLVARSALKPVDRLTDVVEHIARTEEVGATIPVHGSDEIARLSTSFNSMSTALLNSRERQTRLIADAGHELRTPLTSLRTNVDLLIRSDDTGRPLPAATRAKLLGNMKAQMQELTLLIGDLLQLSRPDSARPPQALAVVALHEIADRALERARLRGPGLVFNVAVHPWYVHGDAAALERAVINLLDNAVKYSPPGGAVDVSLLDGRLSVRDHGPGIPSDELQYVFDRFWRSPSSRQLPGSGLGLSIVAQTVRDTGGEVSLGPAADGGPGALATVRLPGQADPPH